jgi:VanZ family protein
LTALLIAIVFFIIYGSLYPWSFRPPPASALDILLYRAHITLDRFIIRDIIVNVAIYVPVGLVGASVFRRWPLRFLWPVLLSAALSFSIEFTQAYIPTRNPSLADFVCNVAGSVFGVIAAGLLDMTVLGRRAAVSDRMRSQRSAMTALGLWVAALTFPFFPVLGRTLLYEKLRVFYYAPFSSITVVSFAAMWFAAGRLGLKAWPHAKRQRWWQKQWTWWLFIAVILLIAGQLFIVERQPLPAEMAGAIIGTICFICVGTRAGAAGWSAWLFLAVILLRGLMPFHPSPLPQDFSWIPFRASLQSDWQPGIATLLDKAFWYFAAVWLIHDSGVHLRTSAIWVAQVLAAIEIAQIWLPGRTPEITDPLLALAAGAVIWLLHDQPVYQPI